MWIFFLFYVRFVSGVRTYKILTFFLLDEDKLDMIFIYDVAILRNATQKHLTEVKRRMLLCPELCCAVLGRVESVSCWHLIFVFRYFVPTRILIQGPSWEFLISDLVRGRTVWEILLDGFHS